MKMSGNPTEWGDYRDSNNETLRLIIRQSYRPVIVIWFDRGQTSANCVMAGGIAYRQCRRNKTIDRWRSRPDDSAASKTPTIQSRRAFPCRS